MSELEQAKISNDKAEEKSNLPNLLDLQDRDLKLSKSTLMVAGEQDFAMPMNNYLIVREQQECNKSYLQTGITFITRMGRTALGMRDASSEFEKAKEDGNHGLMLQLRNEDRQQRRTEHKVGVLTGAGLKTAFLFSGGKVGFGGFAALTTADEAKPADPFPKQAVDAVLGATKGIATRYVFNKINEQSWNPVLKGWSFGMSERFIDSGLTSKNYLNEDGSIDGSSFGKGLLKTGNHVFGPQALMVDAGSLAVSSLLLPINSYTGGAYFRNALASKLTMAGVAGLTDGSLHELNKQQDRGKEQIDWLEVAKKGGERAVLDTIAAAPGSRLFLRAR